MFRPPGGQEAEAVQRDAEMRGVFLWPVRRGEIFSSLQLAEKALSESERKGKELREKPIRGFSRFQSEVFQSFLRSEKLAQSGEKTVSPDWGKFFPPPLQRRGKCGIIENGSCSGIEVVITALTRNQVYPQGYRGFESHPLRHDKLTDYTRGVVCQLFIFKFSKLIAPQ